MILQFLFVGTNTDMLNPFKLNRMPKCASNLKQNNSAFFQIDLKELELNFRDKKPKEPVFQFFVAYFCRRGDKSSANNSVRVVFHPPDKITRCFSAKSCAVAQSRDIFTDLFRMLIIRLKLNPFSFMWIFDQLSD